VRLMKWIRRRPARRRTAPL